MDNNKMKTFQNLALITQIGIMMIVPIFGGLLVGRFLDDKLGTGNKFLLICIILGTGAAFMNLYKIAMKDNKKK
jgi:F0F1-type ATP synthase assembly protein I